MGYYSDHKIEIFKVKENGDKENIDVNLDEWSLFKRKFEEITGFELDEEDCKFNINEAKWYDSDDELTKISKLFPNYLILMERYGEDSYDIVKTIYLNGFFKSDKAQIYFEFLDNNDFIKKVISENYSQNTIKINPTLEKLEKNLEKINQYYVKQFKIVDILPEGEELLNKIGNDIVNLLNTEMEMKFQKEMLTRKQILEKTQELITSALKEEIKKEKKKK
jgi:hypothetical protein